MVYHEVVLLVNSSGMNMQLEALQPVTYKSLHEYGNRYCIGVSSAQNFLASLGWDMLHIREGQGFLLRPVLHVFFLWGGGISNHRVILECTKGPATFKSFMA